LTKPLRHLLPRYASMRTILSLVRRISSRFRFREPTLGAMADATLVVTHAEICSRHGTGALLAKILENEPSLAVFYSHQLFGRNDLGRAVHLEQSNPSKTAARAKVAKILAGSHVSRILCVPYYPDEALSALAASEISDAPIALYIMDDQNIHADGISDELMGELVARSAICFAISEPLRDAYRAKYARDFWIIPPVADPAQFVPPDFEFSQNEPPQGVLIGNVWSEAILTRLRRTVAFSGLQLDWYGNAGKPFIELDPKSLATEGLHLKTLVPEKQLVTALRAADYAVVPAGTLDGTDSHDWLARASLPSRIIYLMATANLPILVLGHPETAAAQFVTKVGLGEVCEYDSGKFVNSVQRLTKPPLSTAIRATAQRLSHAFSSKDLIRWIWRSTQLGHPVDLRYENIFRPMPSNPDRAGDEISDDPKG
jgi:hypothetical protein